MPRSPVFSKKAFLYLGGTILILVGGFIILSAPYHYIGFIASAPDTKVFSIWDDPGYHPQLQISVSTQPGNQSVLQVDFTIRNNDTDNVYTVNMTLTPEDTVPGTNPPVYLKRQNVDLPFGNYTIRIDKTTGVPWMDVGYRQMSDSQLYIGIGAILNIMGLVMGMGGWCVSGSLLLSEDETIIDWGYRPDDETYDE